LAESFPQGNRKKDIKDQIPKIELKFYVKFAAEILKPGFSGQDSSNPSSHACKPLSLETKFKYVKNNYHKNTFTNPISLKCKLV